MITEQDIAQAEQNLDAARGWLLELEETPAEHDVTNAWASAKDRRDRAELILARLRRQRDNEQAALVARAKIEKDSKAELAAIKKRLTGTRETLSERLATAQAALIAVVEAEREHDAAVRTASAELIGLGLPVENGDQPYETGGTGRGHVRLQGEWWLTTNPGDLVTWLAERVRLSRTKAGARHGVLTEVRRYERTHGLDRRTDLKLDDLAMPEEIERTPMPYPASRPMVPATVGAGVMVAPGMRA